MHISHPSVPTDSQWQKAMHNKTGRPTLCETQFKISVLEPWGVDSEGDGGSASREECGGSGDGAGAGGGTGEGGAADLGGADDWGTAPDLGTGVGCDGGAGAGCVEGAGCVGGAVCVGGTAWAAGARLALTTGTNITSCANKSAKHQASNHGMWKSNIHDHAVPQQRRNSVRSDQEGGTGYLHGMAMRRGVSAAHPPHRTKTTRVISRIGDPSRAPAEIGTAPTKNAVTSQPIAWSTSGGSSGHAE
ncbi:hypothetical protein PAXRUDRAFT_829373 [Paxillus rubicundulus Ve08.2h10]|uniref:Uncharacterized protein n=1 Tax=Paxillus rubicundulus Ve08.2h10 TaxID=930991 RepID=A0A0D0DUX4_9AGAM|nr:hypothetical protein PAXRUDRAFT_829373 [Paxillus rubicundulus Ve08.2h10]